MLVKTTALALTFILSLLISIVAGVQFVTVAKANFIPYAEIYITSPANKTYNTNSLILDYNASFSVTEKKRITYRIDEKANVTIFSNQSAPVLWETVYGNVTLPELSDGSHHLEVFAENVNSGYAQVYFAIDTIPPKFSGISIESKSYNTTDIPLNFTVNEPTSWIGYSIDQQANTTIIGNTTLTGLSEGLHSLIIYANDTVGNMGTSKTVYFTIRQKTNQEAHQQTESFPTALIATAVSSVAIVSLSLLIYFKKRNRAR